MKMKTDRKRDSFRSHWGFVIACIGSAVGMGNIWMFPARVSKYGGGSFLIPYFIFVILIGYSGVIGEMAFGRSVHSGPVGAFGAACASRGEKWRKTGELLGCIPMFGALALAIGYSVVVGWIIKYMVGTFPRRNSECGSSLGDTCVTKQGLAPSPEGPHALSVAPSPMQGT